MVKETKLYDDLTTVGDGGLKCPPDADADTLKRCYRKAALDAHPDRPGGSVEKMQCVQNAFDILKDPAKRSVYDRAGMAGLKQAEERGQGQREGEPKPKDTVAEFPVPLDAFYNGATISVEVPRQRFCGACSGRGTNKEGVESTCRTCSGRGVQLVTRQMGPFLQQVQVQCANCGGSGSACKPEDRCRVCDGKQVVRDKKKLDVHIDKGMKKGDHVKFAGEGNQIPNVRLAGDVIIVLDEKPHAVFTRKGDHLFVEHKVSLVQALTGFQIVVQHLDGRKLLVQPPPGVVLDPAMMWAVDREGMPVARTGGCERGQLIVKFTVEYPKVVSEKDVAALRAVLGKPTLPPANPDYEECFLTTTTAAAAAATSREASEDTEEDGGRRGGAQQVNCAQQ